MAILNFGTFLKMTIQDGLVPQKKDCMSSTLWVNRIKLRASFRSQQNLERSCGSTQILPKMSNERLASPSSKACHVTPSLSYDERNGIRLTSWWRPELWKGSAHPSHPFVPKAKPANYYDQIHRGLGYTTPSIQSDLKSEKPLSSHSSYSSDWASDVSVRVSFKKLFVNMTSTSQIEQE